MSTEPCLYRLVCPFYQRRIPIHDMMYATYVERYCNGQHESCAVYQVMVASNFLKVPQDLYPNQTFRVKEILNK
jgi:hypothetical protein